MLSSPELTTDGSRILRGVLRNQLLYIQDWNEFVPTILEHVQTELVKDGCSDLVRMVNEKRNFGAADTLRQANRWVTGLPQTLLQSQCWKDVLDLVEKGLLPRLAFPGQRRDFRPNNEFTCIRQGVFVDPAGSARQSSHIDIANTLLNQKVGPFQLWNIFLPVQQEPNHPETAVHHRQPSSTPYPSLRLGAHDVFFFDGMVGHFGQGNPTSVPRVLVHLVYTQTKLLQHPLGREEISQQFQPGGLDAEPEARNIFDPRTLVGQSVHSDLQLLGVRRTDWEIAGGFSLDPLNKRKSWKLYATSDVRTPLGEGFPVC